MKVSTIPVVAARHSHDPVGGQTDGRRPAQAIDHFLAARLAVRCVANINPTVAFDKLDIRVRQQTVLFTNRLRNRDLPPCW